MCSYYSTQLHVLVLGLENSSVFVIVLVLNHFSSNTRQYFEYSRKQIKNRSVVFEDKHVWKERHFVFKKKNHH